MGWSQRVEGEVRGLRVGRVDSEGFVVDSEDWDGVIELAGWN